MEYDGKKALKDAKEAVKNKDFNAVLELCKLILKNEKNNYLAWVLSAVAFQELGQGDKALTAFTKATELQPTQLTAWQGLAAFLEQEHNKSVLTTDNGEKNKEKAEKLMLAYSKLEELLAGDPFKQSAIWKKQCELYASLNKLEECLLKAQILLEKGDADILKFIIKILSPLQSKLNNNGLTLMEEALVKTIPVAADPMERNHFQEQYLKVLLLRNCYDKSLEMARRILQDHPANGTALDAVCQAFVEYPSSQISIDEASRVVPEFLKLYPNSKYALQAKAALLLKTGAILEARQLLETICLKQKTASSLLLLCEAYHQLHQWELSEKVCRMAHGLDLSEEHIAQWNLKLSKSLLEQNKPEKLAEVSTIFDNVSQEIQETSDFQFLRGLFFVKTGRFDSLVALLDTLEEKEAKENLQPNFVILKSEQLQATGHTGEAIAILEESTNRYPQNVELQLALAKSLWTVKQKQKAVAHLLAVVKINRDLTEPYVLLGSFYGDQADNASLQRGIRCLEKAFHLEPQRADIAKQLLELYRRAGNMAAALKLLDVVINCSPSDSCRWAWIQKGRFLLECMHSKEKTVLDQEKEASLAIGCLQNALRVESNDSSCWETLGDAYMARGSYTAALRAFQKATSLNPDSIYSEYQAANIKQKLGEYDEAIETYEKLLTRCEDYVPALKGLAETLLNQASDFEADGFTGRLMDNCTKAMKLLVQATRVKSHFSCLWSLMGQISLLLRVIAETEFTFQVPALLLSSSSGMDDEEVSVTKMQMMELGVKFHLAAIQLLPDSAALWYNLALCYRACAQLAPEGPSAHENAAMAAVKKAITLEPNESMFWNLLGLVAQQPAVAQHAFIRAVELSPKAAAAWTNLGTLYYEYGDTRLAHECFKQAQNTDPFYVPAWIGQANVAEQLKPSEAMDLFRHTVAIGSGRRTECEGALPYAQWVLATLSDPEGKQKPHYRYSIVEMHAVPAAVDGLNLYTTLYPEDSCALNILGLLYERQGLLHRAEEVLLRGIAVLEEKDCPVSRSRVDKMKANLARVYTSMDRCDDATGLYGLLQESELSSACGIALAHFRAGRFQESYVTYEAALHWLASDDALRSHLLVAMAMAAFRRDLSDPEAAQTLLFQSCQLEPPSVYGLLALAALGLLTDDDTLTDAAFQEMLAYQTDPRYVDRIAFLSAYRHWSSGNSQEASRELCRHIHMLPNISHLWVQLASFQAATVQETKSSPMHQPVDGLLVARCARIASESRQSFDTTATDEQQTQQVDLSKVTSLIGIGYLLADQKKASLIAAQKAVHCNPQSAASWSVLLAAAASSWTSDTSQSSHLEQQLMWLKQLIGHLRRRCDVAAFSGLAPWLGSYERRLTGLLSQN